MPVHVCTRPCVVIQIYDTMYMKLYYLYIHVHLEHDIHFLLALFPVLLLLFGLLLPDALVVGFDGGGGCGDSVQWSVIIGFLPYRYA